MKKILLTLAIAATAVCATPVFAQDAGTSAPEATVEKAVVTEDGDNVTIVYKGETLSLPSEDYQAQKDRNLSDEKIAKNTRIDQADGDGIGVTIMSMCIVLLALIVLSILFMIFGNVFARKQSRQKKEAHGLPDHAEEEDHDSGEVIAAIAMALDEHFNSKHDLEDTVLTIRRMKRAYSPWNSKIYNMRELPARPRH